MKVLVTGANGYLAGHIIAELDKRGYAIRAMLRPGAKSPGIEGIKVEEFRGNITSDSDLEYAVKGCDIVIHTAADTSQAHRRAEDYFPVNVAATEKLIKVIQHEGCRRLIYVSTANTSGFGSVDFPGNENTPVSAFAIKSGYIQSKIIAQQRVLEAVKRQLIDSVVVNPTFMIGPNDYKPSSGRIFKMILGRSFVLCPPGGKNFVDVRDTAQAIVNAIDSGLKGECYLLGGTNLSFRDFFKKVNQLAKQNCIVVRIPSFLLKMSGLTGELLQMLGFQVALTYSNACILCEATYVDNKKAVKFLKLPPPNIDKTITDYLQWKAESPNF